MLHLAQPGIYETLRSFQGVFALLPEHEARMKSSCETLGLEMPDLQGICERLYEKDVRLRVSVSHEGVEVESHHLEPWTSFLYDETWKVKPVQVERTQPNLKSTNTELQTQAREAALKEGFGEVLLVTEDGRITEGGISNVWFVEGETLITPGRDVLPGIARSLILQAAKALEIEVVERDVSLEELSHFDAVFLSNSIRGMVASGPVHPVMKRVANWCTDFIQKRIDAA